MAVNLIGRLTTYPPDPLPLLREGGSVGKRGALPLSKTSSLLSFIEKNTKGELKRGEASLI
jgi:hypothetical protein